MNSGRFAKLLSRLPLPDHPVHDTQCSAVLDHTQTTNYTNICHTEGVSHLSNTLTLLACHFSLCGEGVEEDNTSTSVLALSIASLPVATSLSTPLNDVNSVRIVSFRGVEVLSECPASTVGSCCCWSAGWASTLAGSSGLGYIYVDQPTRTQDQCS